MPRDAEGLTPKQRRFVNEYPKDLNATQAAIRAGYSQRTAGEIGRQNLKKPAIASIIAAKEAKRAQKAGITAERVLEEMAYVGFADLQTYTQWGPSGVTLQPSSELPEGASRAVAEVMETKDGVRFKLHSKTDALVNLGKHLKLFTEKLEHTGVDGAPLKFTLKIEAPGES